MGRAYPQPSTRWRLRLLGAVCAATGAAIVGLVLLTGTSLAQTAPADPPDIPRPLASLKTVKAPEPPNLSEFVQDRAAAIQLGKALYWDMQMGSDGVTACASCHYQAGADVRSKNTLSPGLLAGDTHFQVGGPNAQLSLADFPFHRMVDPDDAHSIAVDDANDVVGAQGVFAKDFNLPGIPGVLTKGVDVCTQTTDPVFNVGGLTTRRVTPRNAPSTINAVYNFRNFWDGRANNNFNGVNPFGDRDPNAVIFKNVLGSSTPQPTHVSIPFSSLASQAVGPPGSPFEMSCDGRIFPNMGRKMLTTLPLARQLVEPTDSVLGPLASSKLKPGAKGLNTTYISMIQKAFKPEYWKSTSLITIGTSSPVALSQLMSDLVKIVSPDRVLTPMKASDQKKVMIPTNQYTQIEANFSLFWGLAIQLYESTLVANDSPVDQYLDGKRDALSAEQRDGLAIFENRGRCISCHGGAETTNASISKVTSARLERMQTGNFNIGVYDDGFYNIGVRPTTDDLGVGGTDPWGNPLSEVGLCQQALKTGKTCDPAVLQIVGRPNNGIPAAPMRANERIVVNGAFKAPGLRNIELTGPYMHNGGMATLRQVVDFYNRGGDFADRNIADLDADIAPLGGLTHPFGQLAESERDHLVAFLIGLTDERVRWERAPFDHPELCFVNGHPGDSKAVTNDGAHSGQATDSMQCLPAVGTAGRTLAQAPLSAFLNATNNPQFHYDPAPVFAGAIRARTDPAAASVAVAADPHGTLGPLFGPPPALGVAPPATLYSWGQTAPHGTIFIPGALGGHRWVADHVMGLCRLDPSPNGLHAVNMSACDPDGTIGSPGQPAYDTRVNPDGSHFVYVPDNSRKSPGMWRLVFDPNTETVSNPVLLVPGAGLAGVRADATAIGPDGNLYVGSLADGNIRRISDPAGDPRKQVVDIIAMTTDGRGINGTMAFVGGDLYLPENRGLSVVRDAASCAPFSCFAELIPLDGVTFVQSVASNGSNTIYVATAAGAGPATIYRYTAGTGAQEVFETQGAIPLGAGATEDCAVTCEHPIDPWLTPGGVTGLHFVLGMDVDPSGTLFLVDDPLVGARFSTGHIWSVAP